MKEHVKELLILPIAAIILSVLVTSCLSQGRKTEDQARQEGYDKGYNDGYTDALMKYGIDE